MADIVNRTLKHPEIRECFVEALPGLGLEGLGELAELLEEEDELLPALLGGLGVPQLAEQVRQELLVLQDQGHDLDLAKEGSVKDPPVA